eukprot:jgi/Phyca11/127472/e_gw1.70.191.1
MWLSGGIISRSIKVFVDIPTMNGLSSDPLSTTGFPMLSSCPPNVKAPVIASDHV